MNILLTGAAGFIGFHLARKLIHEGFTVIGVDNLNPYYDVTLKKSRLDGLKNERFFFEQIDLEDKNSIFALFQRYDFDCIINLAAQAGVRYSLTNPQAYIDSNITGFLNILEATRNFGTEHLIYASSSSVYGINETIPFSVSHNVDHPRSLYAASKKANELMAHTYSELFNIPTTGLRFFTVYGPWGRPDMALYIFTKKIYENETIQLFNSGEMLRDFTYIDDIVEGIFKLIKKPPARNSNWDPSNPSPHFSSAPYHIFNIGNNSPVKLLDFVTILEETIGKKATKEFLPMQLGDVKATYADIDALNNFTGFMPKTDIREGIGHFIEWYKDYHSIS